MNLTTGKLLRRLGTRTLVVVAAMLFVADLVWIDPIPFIDEIVLGVITILLSRWASRRSDEGGEEATGAEKPPPKNITPER